MLTIQELKSKFAQHGKVDLILVRTERIGLPRAVAQVNAMTQIGLEGDHYKSKGGKRQVTLIMQEHLDAVASILNIEKIDPLLIRRNIVTSGINLLSLKDKQFQIGDVLFEYSGECHPCSRMEENLGLGGYNAMRGHGGITARVINGGIINSGDRILVKP